MSFTRTLVALAALTLLVPVAGAASDDSPSTAEVISAYAAIGNSLAADSAEGIAEHVAVLQEFSTKHEPLQEPAAALSADNTGLPDLRTAYKSFSEPFLEIAKANYSPNEVDENWTIVHCSMAKGSWIQADGAVANPYFGSKMLRCGKKVGTLGAEASSADDAGHEGHGGHEHMKSNEHSSMRSGSHGDGKCPHAASAQRGSCCG